MAIPLDAILRDMKAGLEINNGWFKPLFQWTPLGQFLKKNELTTLWEFIQVYSSSRVVIRWWFRRFVRDLQHQFQLDCIVHVVQILKAENLFHQDIFFPIIQNSYFKELIEILELLQYEGILNQNNFNDLIKHEHISQLVWTFSVLQNEQLLTQENFNVIIHHQKPDATYPLFILHEAKIVNQVNFDIIVSNPNPNNLVLSLSILQRSQLLTQENFELVANHVQHEALAWILRYLNLANILTVENRALIIQHPQIYQLAELLEILQHARLLNQINLDAILNPQHAVLLDEEIENIVWERINQRQLTQQNFERILIAATQMNPLEALRITTNQILNETHRSGRLIFNDHQSTHTASVHRSVSESARKLKELYGHMNIDESIKNLKTLINGLSEDNLKHIAAKHAIEDLASSGSSFIDKSSDVSLYQLVAYAFEAIHDDIKRIGTLDDAKKQLIEALYESQRGYNFNDEGIDNGHPEEHSICPAGSFNKMIEKLNGIHHDIEVLYITPAGASLKLPRLAHEYTITYLESLNQEAFKESVEGLKDGSLEAVWPRIREAVEEELWSEFKDAYANNRDDKRFQETINNGVYLPAPSLTLLNQIERRLSIRLSNSPDTLWSKNQVESDAQSCTLKLC